jgi:hypothetical protein
MMHLLESIGLKESIIIILAFSAFVIVTDEILHARARKRREAEGRQEGQ